MRYSIAICISTAVRCVLLLVPGRCNRNCHPESVGGFVHCQPSADCRRTSLNLNCANWRTQLLFDLYPTIQGVPGAILAQNKIIGTAAQYLAGLSADVASDKGLALEVGESYMQVARIQGVPAWNNLGQYAEAEENLRKADRLLDSVLVADPHNRNALWLSANVAHDRASVAYYAGSSEQAIAGGSKVYHRFDELIRLGNLSRKEINGATYIYGDLAEHQMGLHRFEDAVRYCRLGIEIFRTNSTIAGPHAQTFSILASALKYMGDFPGALEAIRQARDEWDKYRNYDSYSPSYGQLILALVRSQEGLILAEEGSVDLKRPLEAANLFREAFDALEERAKIDPKDYQARTHLAESGR
jgi:tetratricopeptide (TPR) repeat protein